LPAVIFGPIAGVVLDRVSKKTILVVSNAARVVSQGALAIIAYLGLNGSMNPVLFVGLVYLVIFITSAIGQFFAPAEGATIPLIVKRDELYAANSLFTLTIVGIQVVALILYVPVSVKSFGIVGALISLTVFYLAATVLLLLLPRDPVAHRVKDDGESGLQRGWREIGEGWRYAISHKPVFIAILQFSLVFTIVSVLGEQAPGYANRVLGLATEDAVYVFSPAGIGIVLASLFVVRFGQKLPRYVLPIVGMFLMGVGLVGLGAVGLGGANALVHIFEIAGVSVTAVWLIGVAAPLIGVGIALVLIPAQTSIQEGATDEVRGRVLTVQLTLANALSIPLLLAAGGFSDVFGIPQIVIFLGAVLFPLALANWLYARNLPPPPPAPPFHSQPIPIAGESIAMVEETKERQTQARSKPAE
jgi:MFS family permease